MSLAVVTGASGGIGLELSKILAREGHDLLLVARSEERLKEISQMLSSEHGVQVSYLAADLTDISSAETVAEMGAGAEILVNNAGFGDYGEFVSCDWDKQQSMIELNIMALTKITRLILPEMVSAGRGRILNIASIASFAPGPLMSVYYASKAYVLSLTEALSVELKGTGVTVTAVCPGPVNTNFFRAANADDVSAFKRFSGADPVDVAEFAHRKMMKGKVVAVHGVLFKVASFFMKILPKALVRKLVHIIQRNRPS